MPAIARLHDRLIPGCMSVLHFAVSMNQLQGINAIARQTIHAGPDFHCMRNVCQIADKSLWLVMRFVTNHPNTKTTPTLIRIFRYRLVPFDAITGFYEPKDD
jgi:hypothetical protein